MFNFKCPEDKRYLTIKNILASAEKVGASLSLTAAPDVPGCYRHRTILHE